MSSSVPDGFNKKLHSSEFSMFLDNGELSFKRSTESLLFIKINIMHISICVIGTIF